MDPPDDGNNERRDRLVAIGEVAVEIVHELRNVLQIISASTYLARKNPAEASPHLDKVERNARIAHAIVDDLMALARGDTVTGEPTLVADVLLAARDEGYATSAVWDDAVHPASLRGSLHAGLIVRLIHALYDNAIAVSAPARPTITTRAWQEGPNVVIEIADDGPGVPADIASHIFNPLVTHRKGGSGLGLALARRIAEAHKGTITLVSSAKGATFRIELPASTMPKAVQ